jgi:hypothetical protein
VDFPTTAGRRWSAQSSVAVTEVTRTGRDQISGHSPRDDEAGLTWRLQVLEARREEATRFAWAVPGLVIAAQAFLFTIALSPNTHPYARLISSAAGLLAVLATGHLMAKQVYNFDVYEAVIERDRKVLGLPGVQMDALTDDPDSLPENTNYRKRRWSSEELWRHRLVVQVKTVKVWRSRSAPSPRSTSCSACTRSSSGSEQRRIRAAGSTYGAAKERRILATAVASYSALPEPMLARSGRLPTSGDFAYEVKCDGRGPPLIWRTRSRE